nr:hypothetical protein TDPV-308 [Oriental turtle dovepox virus]
MNIIKILLILKLYFQKMQAQKINFMKLTVFV